MSILEDVALKMGFDDFMSGGDAAAPSSSSSSSQRKKPPLSVDPELADLKSFAERGGDETQSEATDSRPTTANPLGSSVSELERSIDLPGVSVSSSSATSSDLDDEPLQKKPPQPQQKKKNPTSSPAAAVPPLERETFEVHTLEGSSGAKPPAAEKKTLGVSVLRKIQQQQQKPLAPAPAPPPPPPKQPKGKVEDLETLVQAFRRDNDNLQDKLKEEAERRKEDAERSAAQTEEARREARELKTELGKCKSDLEAAERRYAERDRAAKASEESGARLKEEIAELKASNLELRRSLDKAIAGGQTESQMGDERVSRLSEELRKAREELEVEMAAHKVAREKAEEVARGIEALRKELESRDEDVKRAKEQAALVEKSAAVARKEHARRTQELEAKVVAAERGGAATKRVKELEKQVRDLQDSIVRKNPNSIAALVRAVGNEDGDVVSILKREIEAMREERKRKDAEAEKRLLAMRTEHERLRSDCETKTRDLEAAEETERKLRTQLKDVQAQLDTARKHWREKLGDMQERLQESQASSQRPRPQQATVPRTPPPPPPPSQPQHQQQAVVVVNREQEQRLDKELRQMQCELHASKIAQSIIEQKSAEVLRHLQAEHSSQLELLRQQHKDELARVVAQQKRQDELQQELSQAEKELLVKQLQTLQHAIGEAVSSRGVLEQQLREVTSSLRDSEARRESVSTALQSAQVQLATLDGHVASLTRELDASRARFETLEDTVRDLQSTVLSRDAQIDVLRGQCVSLQKALAKNPRPPGAEEYQELEERVADIEAKHRATLAEREGATASLRQRYEKELASKNAQISHFRAELAQLISVVEAQVGARKALSGTLRGKQ